MDGRSRILRPPDDEAETRRLHAAAFACPTRSIRPASGRPDPALDPFPMALDEPGRPRFEWILPGHGDRRRLAADEMSRRLRAPADQSRGLRPRPIDFTAVRR
ncbi:hypothetical protein Airi01_019030 [Actinoallomurus iriomotensis]|uniref:Uncharacterized protein n=1 Tax=Actinoallomurus iriomotensis TaxID=478107 RepID=A0A9W6RCT5_9ACTN|nr:hypothetical protein Airi01_019030 [Actinoallomurus iriomotensis]